MDRTLAHELAEEFAGVENPGAQITEFEDGSYKVELTSDITVRVDTHGNCSYSD